MSHTIQLPSNLFFCCPLQKYVRCADRTVTVGVRTAIEKYSRRLIGDVAGFCSAVEKKKTAFPKEKKKGRYAQDTTRLTHDDRTILVGSRSGDCRKFFFLCSGGGHNLKSENMC
jgi:hypothetical protein